MTEKDESGRWQVKGLPWERLQEGQAITKETGQILYGCLCKLKAYEDCGMGPDQLEGWKDRLEDVAAHVCDKLCRHPMEVRNRRSLMRYVKAARSAHVRAPFWADEEA